MKHDISHRDETARQLSAELQRANLALRSVPPRDYAAAEAAQQACDAAVIALRLHQQRTGTLLIREKRS